MYLKQLIDRLEKADPGTIIRHGFCCPQSYRGYYEQLAFAPADHVRVGEMLASAKEALGATYGGYKGGDFTMTEYTECWLAKYGDTGEELGALLLDYMLADVEPPTEGCQHLWKAHTHGRADGTADAVCSLCGWCPNQNRFTNNEHDEQIATLTQRVRELEAALKEAIVFMEDTTKDWYTEDDATLAEDMQMIQRCREVLKAQL